MSADDLALSTAVAHAQDGGEAAFSALYRSVQPGLHGYLHGLLGEAAEDVAAAVWREIARELPRFRGDGHGFRGWTASIARRHTRGHLRRHGAPPRPASTRTPPAGDHTGHPPPGAVLSAETAQALIARLPYAQAEAVLLRHVVRLDEPAVARVMGRPVLVVRVIERRGLRSLARLLDTSDVTHNVVRTLGEPG
ncbi:sigma-70 family RNA polymerase sigma factor [Streptomyces sp. tea 10]|nr:sigma-70 family RNA polymerase sigma factor [Streptomyces sp. tea 10]